MDVTPESPSLAVVEAVADAEDVEAADLDCKLADAIDPTALDRVVESMDGAGIVVFRYYGYEVTVRVDVTIDVELDEPGNVG